VLAVIVTVPVESVSGSGDTIPPGAPARIGGSARGLLEYRPALADLSRLPDCDVSELQEHDFALHGPAKYPVNDLQAG
jgi:hypothetical protein